MIKLLDRIFARARERTINEPIYLDFLQNHLPEYFQDIPLDVRQRNRMVLQYITLEMFEFS